MLVLEACILLAFDLCSLQEGLDKSFTLGDLDDADLVGVDGVEDVLSHLGELGGID